MKKIEKLLTITIPAYNVETYLYRCLDSILECRDLLGYVEVLIINDGSLDRTEEIALEYAGRAPGTFRLISKENGGHGSAINTGIRHASGRYFLVLDGDDWLNTKALRILLETIKDLPPESQETACGAWKNRPVDLISYHYNRVDMHTGISEPVKQQNVQYSRVYAFDKLPDDGIYFALASICYRTGLLRDIGLRLQEHTYYVDVEYMLLPVPAIQNVLFLDIYLYKYFVGNELQSIYIPTMVKRYAHHDRVVRRVITETAWGQIGEMHKRYLFSILGKVLYTHYAAALIYDDCRRRGIRRAREFDSFLYAANAELYDHTRGQIPFLRIYRKYHFQETRIKRAYLYKTYLACAGKIKLLYSKVRKWRFPKNV